MTAESPRSRLAQLEELIDALRPVVLASHSEHGLQGLSGLVGQYRAALAEIESLRAQQPEKKGTVLDELAKRRAEPPKPSARSSRTARGN